jgi:protein TIF31
MVADSQDVAMHEMVSRAAKHVFSRYLRKLPLLDVPSCVAHLLNCFVGFRFNPCPQAHLATEDEFSSSSAPEWTRLYSNSIKEQVNREVFKRYRYRLDGEWWNQARCIVLLREVCLKMGFQIKARDYTFEKVEIVTTCPAKTKKTNGTNGHKVDETTFYPDDVLNVVPIVKDAPLKVTSHL